MFNENLIFLIALYSPKNDTKQPSEMRNYHRRSYFTVTKVFLGLGPFLTTDSSKLQITFWVKYFVRVFKDIFFLERTSLFVL